MSLVKSFSVGNGDMFYIKHNTDSFTIIDCKLSEDDQDSIMAELKTESKDKGITRFISTHPDDDHICGLAYLNSRINLLNFYCVKNEATKEDWTEDFEEYCKLRDDQKKAFHIYKDCPRKWMNQDSSPDDEQQRQGAGIHVLWPITTNADYRIALAQAKEGKCPNNISAVVQYAVKGGASILWMGDLETGFMEQIQDEIPVPKTDILFAPHHGRDSGKVPGKWLAKMQPKVIIIGEAPSEHLNYYEGYNTITQNSAGHITLDCLAGKTRIYVSEPDYYADFLEHGNVENNYGGYYIGTLATNGS